MSVESYNHTLKHNIEERKCNYIPKWQHFEIIVILLFFFLLKKINTHFTETFEFNFT